jgi:hypothetical protein
MRLGIVTHYGWAVAVTASIDHAVVDRRRLDLIEAGLPAAPVHHEGGPHTLHRREAPLDDDALEALVARVRASVTSATDTALADLAATVPGLITSVSLRDWSDDFPVDIAVVRRPPYEARADSVMYRQVLAERASAHGWAIHRYDATTVEAAAVRVLGDRAHDVLHGPRAALGPPWTKDHRTALAATVVATSSS